jgi:hypothetical protein
MLGIENGGQVILNFAGLREPTVGKGKPESELKRLLKPQKETLEDEIFGGLSPAERAQFDRRMKRINELAIELAASAPKAEQQREWNKVSETDSPHAEVRQPYRSREKDSAHSYTDSMRKQSKGSSRPDERGRE